MAEQDPEWWREAIPRFGMRSLFHALCDLGRDDCKKFIRYEPRNPNSAGRTVPASAGT